MIAEEPDLFLFLGDAIYSDTDGLTAWNVTEMQLQGEWNRLADKPEYQRFRAGVPIMATWDNHDYGTHNGGADFELKEVSKKMFLDSSSSPPNPSDDDDPESTMPKCSALKANACRSSCSTHEHSEGHSAGQCSSEQRTQIGKVGKYVPHEVPNPDPR